ncbi:MAG: D-alanyl-D-alanine carboxypeptidase family protein [Evtepia sp.]
MKRILIFLLLLSFVGIPGVAGSATTLMEKESGTILSEENAHDKLEPASVTKVMTLLLIFEALDQGQLTREDTVSVSQAAAGMGGSQVYLKEGEQMSVHEMLKAIAVASGNDASVAMAEHLAGSEAGFVEKMNARAAELGMADTTFQNCTGLPAEGHESSAHDIAVMSRELILKHPAVREYTTIWMDTLREGKFQLANTNKLIYYYNGATGLKTGSTDTAHYCLSATAERDGMELIAVVLGFPTSVARFERAKALLNDGFANYAMVDVRPSEAIPPVLVGLGVRDCIQPELTNESRILMKKANIGHITTELSIVDSVEAPVEKGQTLGTMTVSVNGEVYDTLPLVALEAIARMTTGQIFKEFLAQIF